MENLSKGIDSNFDVFGGSYNPAAVAIYDPTKAMPKAVAPYRNADASTFDIFTVLNNAVDANGLKLNVSLSATTYLYMAVTGVLVFAVGAVIWNVIGKKI